jgi:hypothetical protein
MKSILELVGLFFTDSLIIIAFITAIGSLPYWIMLGKPFQITINVLMFYIFWEHFFIHKKKLKDKEVVLYESLRRQNARIKAERNR